jgi:hypothetical protein
VIADHDQEGLVEVRPSGAQPIHERANAVVGVAEGAEGAVAERHGRLGRHLPRRVAGPGHHVEAEWPRTRGDHARGLQEQRAVVDAERTHRGRSKRCLERVVARGAEAQGAQEGRDLRGAVAEAGEGIVLGPRRGQQARQGGEVRAHDRLGEPHAAAAQGVGPVHAGERREDRAIRGREALVDAGEVEALGRERAQERHDRPLRLVVLEQGGAEALDLDQHHVPDPEAAGPAQRPQERVRAIALRDAEQPLREPERGRGLEPVGRAARPLSPPAGTRGSGPRAG